MSREMLVLHKEVRNVREVRKTNIYDDSKTVVKCVVGTSGIGSEHLLVSRSDGQADR